jgi:two-component system, NarL family, response regulator NreC
MTDRVRVLLVEDHEIVRAALKVLINSEPDMDVVGHVGDGLAAVAETQRLRPDVVVMDISLPGLSGLGVIEVLNQRCPEVKVLTLTRHAAEGYLNQIIRSGARGYVLKQSRAEELLRGIRVVASGGKYLDPALADHLVNGKTTDDAHSSLTPREEQVSRLIAVGYTNKEAADRLGVSVKTIEAHKANAMSKLGISSRIDLVQLARIRGWFDDL